MVQMLMKTKMERHLLVWQPLTDAEKQSNA